MRFLQHKEEAYWFYRYLSIVYDTFINPFFHTPLMRDKMLVLLKLDSKDLKVADVGCGSGFATEGVIKFVDPKNVTGLDQSDYQLANAKKKAHLKDVSFQQGDAENLPWETDQFDRYVSSGSIEYWPDPQRAIAESYRILKPEGRALNMGPIKPNHWLGGFLAEVFMLFPTKDEYVKWYQDAGFVDIEYIYTKPNWIQKEDYAIGIVGRKPKAGPSPWTPALDNVMERPPAEKNSSSQSFLLFAFRFVVGSIAGAAFVPIAIIKTIFGLLSPRPSKESSS
jgi:MPBQ/MSBQ methyltransferase